MALGVALEAEGGVTSRLLKTGAVGCICAFALGLRIISTASWDELPDRMLLRRSAGHTRLFFGAMDTAIVLLLLGAVERVPARREAWEASTVAYRRFARLSFSLYIMQEVTTRLLWLLLTGLLRTLRSRLPAVLGEGWAALKLKKEKVDLASCEGGTACLHAHAMLCLCLMFVTVAFHGVLLALWERIGFAGSFEAWAAGRIGKRADEAQASVAAGPVGSKGKWPVVFASIALITWAPALMWSSVSSLMLPPYSEVDAATETVFAANKVSEEELTGQLLLLTLVVPLVLAAASLLAEHKHANLPARHFLFSGVLFAWVAYHSVYAAGSLWLAVPAVGLFRAEFGAVGLGLVCAAVAWAPRRALQLSGALLVAGLLGATPPRYLTQQPSVVASNASVDVYGGVLSTAACEAIEQAAWEQQTLWTKVTKTGALPYFSFGWIANFDEGEGGKEANVPLWSWRHGLRPLLGHESANALLPAGRARRAAIQDELLKLATPLEPLRDAIAKHVGVAASQVVFGGEDAATSSLGFPGIQIYLPNALWQVVANPHTDKMYSTQYGLGEDPTCVNTTLTTFLVPVVAPEGAGLLFWNASGEHEVMYEMGSLYAFDALLMHSIKPWYEWRAMLPRMTLQAFGMQCGETWYVYH